MAYFYGILAVIGWGFTLMCASFVAGFFFGRASASRKRARGFDVVARDQLHHEKQL
jgi:hypothetical protein